MKASCLILVVFLKSSFLFSSDGYMLSSFNLEDGSSPYEGRVEVGVIDGDDIEYGVLSDIDWTIDAADMVCRQRGYPNAVFSPGASRFGRGSRSKVFRLDDNTGRVELVCEYPNKDDSDEIVEDCRQREVEAAGVVCNKPGCFRIPGGERRNVNMSRANTNDMCLEYCQNASTLFAAQREEMCFCFNNYSILPDMGSNCDRQCRGNDQQWCGGHGGDIFTVFNVTAGFCPEISGVNLNVNGRYRFGDIVRANCSGGLRLMGDDVLQCTGGPDVFDWNVTVPACINATTVQPSTTNSPGTNLTGITTMRVRPTGTGVGVIADATTTISVNVSIDTDARTDSKSIAVQVALSAAGVMIVVVLAILLVLYIIRTRKSQSGKNQDIQATSPKSKFDNLSYSMQNIPNNEGPNYYKVGQNAVTDGTEGTDGLIDNVLYKPADDVRRGPNQYEHDRSSPNDTPRYGLIDNVLYKPVPSTADPHNHASNNFRQLPNGYDLPTNDSEYAFPDEHGSKGGHPEGELMDNILYKTADNKVQNAAAASRKYYKINPEPTSGDYAEADRPIQDNIVQNGRRYYDIEPQSSHSPPRSNAGNRHNDHGYDPVHEAGDDTYEQGPRFVIREGNTSSASHGYTAVVDNGEGLPSNVASNNAASAAAVAAVGGKPFPRYAKVQKSRKTEI